MKSRALADQEQLLARPAKRHYTFARAGTESLGFAAGAGSLML
jgi:hypothetical protein